MEPPAFVKDNSYPSIYQIIRSAGSKRKSLREEIEEFLSVNRYCERIIGTGSFGTISDRSRLLVTKPEVLGVKRIPVNFSRLVVKDFALQPARVQPEHADQRYPFYFSVIKSGKLTIVDTDNNVNVGGFVNEIFGNMLCTELFRKVSPHFTYMADFSMCGDRYEYYFENLGYDHTYKDGRQETLSNLYEYLHMWQNDGIQIDDDMMSGLLLGVFHSLHVMNINFNMSHFDMHLGNVYMKMLNHDKYFGGQDMLKFKYFAYHVADKIYYVKNPGFIIKIGDLGLSTFTLGNTVFLNKFARIHRHPERFEKYLSKTDGKNPDHAYFLSHIFDRFTDRYKSLDRLRQIMYPMNELHGLLGKDAWEGGFHNFDSSKIPVLKDVLLNQGVFDHLCKKPKISDSHVLHIKDDVIVSQLV